MMFNIRSVQRKFVLGNQAMSSDLGSLVGDGISAELTRINSHPQKTAGDRQTRARSRSGKPLSYLVLHLANVRYQAANVKMGDSGGVTLKWRGIAAFSAAISNVLFFAMPFSAVVSASSQRRSRSGSFATR